MCPRFWVSFCLFLLLSVGAFSQELWDEYFHPEEYNADFTDEGYPLVESDMVIPDPAEYEEEDPNRRFSIRGRWPLGEPVKFLIEPDQEHVRTAIMTGLQAWMDHTCIKFEEVPANFSGEPHFRFIKSHGCWSYVGRLKRPKGQPVSIGPGCGGAMTVAHEIAHSLGFHHEQSRPDRGEYIEILFDNIAKGKAGNFIMHNHTNSFNVIYDLTSIQHYMSWYFPKSPGLRTLQSHEPTLQHMIGRRGKTFSHRDSAMFNAAYECSAHCESPPVCQNEGFVNKDCVCVCPHDITGEFCENKPDDWTYYVHMCPKAPQIITGPGTIKSHNYPKDMPTNSFCYWRIFAPKGQHVQLTFSEITMNDYPNCSRDQMLIGLGPDIRDVTQSDCGDVRLRGVTVTSVENEMMLTFRTRGPSGRKRRFVAEVEFVPDA